MQGRLYGFISGSCDIPRDVAFHVSRLSSQTPLGVGCHCRGLVNDSQD